MMSEIRGDFVMEALSKLERTIAGWVKDVPHLPVNARKWLGENIWWITLIGAILAAIAALVLLGSLFTALATFGSPVVSYYASPTFLGWVVVTTAVSLFFMILEVLLLSLAITPLKEKQKKGWVLLFASWLVGVVYAVLTAVLTLNIFLAFGNLILSAVWIAVSGYFLFELHSQFAHTEKSKGVKEKKV